MQAPQFDGCGCLNETVANRTADMGVCGQDCNYLAGFLVSVTVFVFLIFMLEVPTLLVTIRYLTLSDSIASTRDDHLPVKS